MDKLSHLRLAASLFMLALLAGCAAKKTAGPPLPPAQAPTAAASPEPTPQPSPTPAQQSQLPAQGTPPPEPDQTQPAESKNDQKPNNAKHGGKKPSSTQGGARETAKNSKIVVHPDAEPPASGGQISPGGADVARGEPTTDQLLQSTENNLNNLKGQLSSDEQDTVAHIRDYINQSRQATRDNDTARAHNLALKAHLTCDDLIKRRQ